MNDTQNTNLNENEAIWKGGEKEDKTVNTKKTFANKPEKTSNVILTINPNDSVRIIDPEKALWHELNTALRKKTILKSTVDEISKTPNGMGIVVTYYKNQRITIPLTQMGIVLSDDSKYQEPLETRLFKFATTLIGAEIDFVIKSVDEANRVVVASRKEALVDKIRTYYATLDKDKVSMIGNNPDVQARVISVGRKNLGVEVFGVQTQINAKDVFYEWVVDLRNDFSAGDVILVNVEEIQYPEYFDGCEDDENWLLGIRIKANHKKFEKDYPSISFENHTVGSKTRGTITEITDNGTIHIILRNKVNAIAHVVAGNRTPLVGDVVSYVCTRKDEKTHVSIGQITKILSSEY